VGGGTSFSPFHTMLGAYVVGREGQTKPGLSLSPQQLWWQHTAGAAQALATGRARWWPGRRQPAAGLRGRFRGARPSGHAFVGAAHRPCRHAWTSCCLRWIVLGAPAGPITLHSALQGWAQWGLALIQPLLAGRSPARPAVAVWPVRGIPMGRVALVGMVIVHVAGVVADKSRPDVIDALLFDSPTPFRSGCRRHVGWSSPPALLAAFRRALRIRPRAWRIGHTLMVVVVVIGSVLHALLVEGTMGPLSKAAFCAPGSRRATAKALYDLRAWTLLKRRSRLA